LRRRRKGLAKTTKTELESISGVNRVAPQQTPSADEIVSEIRIAAPPERVFRRWLSRHKSCNGAGKPGSKTKVRWELEVSENGTLVRIRHSGFAAYPELAQA
jgi:hypothetical protein